MGRVVNKTNPDLRIEEFTSRAEESLADWQAIDAAIVANGGTLRLRRRAATDSFISLAISWESFMSSWFTAAVNREPRKAIRYLTNQLSSYAQNELRIPANILSSTLLTSSHVTHADVVKILDKNGRNFVMADFADFTEKSKRWLYHPYGTRTATISEAEFSTAYAARILRNLFAHESSSAAAEAWKLVTEYESLLPSLKVTSRTERKFSITSWRGYILESVGKKPRVQIFHEELSLLAGKLRR